MWVVCTKCGAGYGFEDFARSDPRLHRPLKIRELPRGTEENNIETVWVPTCTNCENDTFHVQLDPEDMIEFLEGSSRRPVSVDDLAGPADSIEVWRARANQAEQEFQRWREVRRKGT